MMSDILFTALELAAMVIAALFARYLVPYAKQMLRQDKVTAATEWIRSAVYFVQQTMQQKTGAEKKRYVVDCIADLCEKSKIPLTAQQIDILIEAAVKELKVEEGKTSSTETIEH